MLLYGAGAGASAGTAAGDSAGAGAVTSAGARAVGLWHFAHVVKSPVTIAKDFVPS